MALKQPLPKRSALTSGSEAEAEDAAKPAVPKGKGRGKARAKLRVALQWAPSLLSLMTYEIWCFYEFVFCCSDVFIGFVAFADTQTLCDSRLYFAIMNAQQVTCEICFCLFFIHISEQPISIDIMSRAARV